MGSRDLLDEVRRRRKSIDDVCRILAKLAKTQSLDVVDVVIAHDGRVAMRGCRDRKEIWSYATDIDCGINPSSLVSIALSRDGKSDRELLADARAYLNSIEAKDGEL